jgi:serine/threonine-protein kinase
LDAEDDINKFLARFPDDPRNVQLKNYVEEIELLRLERRMELRPGLSVGDPADRPIERDYADAMRDAANAPEQAVTKLQAILDFYGQMPGLSETSTRFVELSRRQLVHVRQQITRQAPAHLKLIDENLSRANRLIASDPAKARAIASSIVELYGDKPWAADQVAKARRMLEIHDGLKTAQ